MASLNEIFYGDKKTPAKTQNVAASKTAARPRRTASTKKENKTDAKDTE